MKSVVKISIVIPNHNRVDALALTFRALERQTFPVDNFEVILVDQASTDGSRELIKMQSLPYQLRLVEQNEKYGPSVARNYGVDAAEGSLIIFLDSDIIADPMLIEAHLALHNRFNNCILSCGRVLPYLPSYNTFVEKAANPDAGLDRGGDDDEFPFYWVFSNHLSITRQAFEAIGQFDPTLTAFEDIEFAYRAYSKGYGIKNCKTAIGYHNHPRSLDERCNRARKYNRLLPRVYSKYPEMQTLIPEVRPFEPIHWHADTIPWIGRKILARFYSLPVIRWLFFRGCLVLNVFPVSTLAAKFFYYRLIVGYGYLGFSESKEVFQAAHANS